MTRIFRLVAIMAGVLLSASFAVFATVQPSAASQRPAAAHGGSRPDRAAALQYLESRGYLPDTAPAGDSPSRSPAGTAAGPPTGGRSVAAVQNQPVTGPSANGLAETDVSPSDSTGAIGPDSYIEMINRQIGIYSRSLGLIASASFGTLTGQTNGVLDDPQIIWDPVTNRFYYVILNAATDNLQWGFSTSANPASIPGDFCNYTANLGYGTTLPDTPVLGDTEHSLLIGVTLYNTSGFYEGSDIGWITKPSGTGTITTCPSAGSFLTGKSGILQSAGGGQSYAPDPAVQTDPSTTGWIVSDPSSMMNTGSATSLDLFKVTENANGTPNIPTTATPVSVSAYSRPPVAPEPGESIYTGVVGIDTDDVAGETSTTHAVTGIDPSRGGTALWTALASAGGAGSEVFWYEINVAASNLYQSGTVSNSSLDVFNPAISPDRAVSTSGSAAFGSDMVLGVTTSSSTAEPTDQMVSKIGGNPQSGLVPVHVSPGNDAGFDCLEQAVCDWGFYGGASPDPAANQSGTKGNVWLSQMFSTGGGPTYGQAEWGTWNWEATP